MTDTTQITPEQRADILRKLSKLMNTKGTTEAEASARVGKAQALLAQYNLTMDDVEREGDGSGRRADEKLRGGFYQWERDLWEAVAELNFCWYMRWWNYVDAKPRRYRVSLYSNAYDAGEVREVHGQKKVYQHRLIGRVVNIAQTKAMAGYLMQVTNRLTMERLHGDNSQGLSKWAISFREGITARVVEKLQDRRRQALREEEERVRAARKMAMEGASTETGLTLATLTKRESEANADFVFGEGWSAKKAAERANRAAWRKMSEDQRTQMAADNPEEARRQAERDRDEERAAKRPYRGGWGGGSTERVKDMGAFRAGYEAGERVSIDQQAGDTKVAGRLK